MPFSVLEDLRTYKIPGLQRASTIKARGQGPRILLFARNGFSQRLLDAAETDERVEFIDADQLVRGLLQS